VSKDDDVAGRPLGGFRSLSSAAPPSVRGRRLRGLPERYVLGAFICRRKPSKRAFSNLWTTPGWRC
ncbi:MAG TPA: hypothetical protein PK384_14015, partial [Candidatus Latescibacteria bacterium]|nr:hypothetical protein [Candidatus Latescibacterota bacterium]